MNAVAAKKKDAAPKKAPAKKAAAKGDAAAVKNRKLYDVIVRPVLTEKAHNALQFNKVTFAIAPGATKRDVKAAVESLFKVDVVKVNTINTEGKLKNFRGQRGQRSDLRKAIVTLAAGQSIDLAAGLR
jgi:large subunit ribosomal protein L23